jgi:uncharacterized membrane protein required for colicin V production
MSLIIDLVILALILLCVFFGYKKGLTKCVIKILAFVIAVVVAAIFFKPISNMVIEKTQIDDNIKNSIVSLVKDDVEETGKVSEETSLPQSMVNYINESIDNSINEVKTTVVENTADQISKTVINVGVAIILFVLARIALMFVSALSSIITDLPLIKQFDKVGGIIYGLIEALIIIFVVFAIISFISPMIEGSELILAINKSILGSALYNNNLLLNIIF